MNVCIFVEALPVHIIGGITIHIQELINGLISRGHYVTVITTRHPENIGFERKNNLDIYYINEKLFPSGNFFYESMKLFTKLNRNTKFDIVHSQENIAYGIAKYYPENVHLIVTIHGTPINGINGILSIKPSLRSYIVTIPLLLKKHFIDYSLILKKANKIITVSESLRNDIRNQYKISNEKLITINNGVDTNLFKPFYNSNLKKTYRIKSNEKILLFVGRIEKQKGCESLLEILKELDNDVKLLIVGEGSYLPHIKEMAKELSITDRIIYSGQVLNEELPYYYAIGDVFVFPSLGREGLPFVVLEAMACGMPVVGNNSGGVKEIINNHNVGILIEFNTSKMKDEIIKLLENKDVAKKIGENARNKIITNFSTDQMVNSTIKIYETFL
ncbi:MAG: glycosyltransferase family 4 protein [Methanosarcinales archaeon]|nr:glycosyltransferase family 4 protein [Methanosarcinales archaeon]